jgi:hypothetical protein
MSLTDKVFEKITDGIFGLMAKKYTNDILFIDEVQKLIEVMHGHYLDCYRKYDGILSEENNSTIYPHPVLVEIRKDSIFGTVDRDKLNGMARYKAKNAVIAQYLSSITDYMCQAVQGECESTRTNSGRGYLFNELFEVLKRNADGQTYLDNAYREFVFSEIGHLLDAPLDRATQPRMNGVRPFMRTRLEEYLSYFDEDLAARFWARMNAARGIDLTAPRASATAQKSENIGQRIFGVHQISACRELISVVTEWHRRGFERVCSHYVIARRTLI